MKLDKPTKMNAQLGTPTVSVIIPTYNRKERLLHTLESLDGQSYPAGFWEIIVVDDGGGDGTSELCASLDELPLRYVRQAHLGGTAAKNRGASESLSDFLLFLDDDIAVNRLYIETLIGQHQTHAHALVQGVLRDLAPDAPWDPAQLQSAGGASECVEVPFTACLGGFFSIGRADFVALGMLQDPAPGFWPNWEDIDLAYRAKQRGFTFWQCEGAVGYHRDHVLTNLKTQCRRWEHAARSAVPLFQKHPGLENEIPMFRDKGPIDWENNPPRLVLRKLTRQVISAPPALKFMEALLAVAEKRGSHARMQSLLSRWIISSYIYRGYRSGLQEFA